MKQYVLLAGDKFMPEMHLRQPGFTNCASRLFTKSNKNILRNNRRFKTYLPKSTK